MNVFEGPQNGIIWNPDCLSESGLGACYNYRTYKRRLRPLFPCNCLEVLRNSLGNLETAWIVDHSFKTTVFSAHLHPVLRVLAVWTTSNHWTRADREAEKAAAAPETLTRKGHGYGPPCRVPAKAFGFLEWPDHILMFQGWVLPSWSPENACVASLEKGTNLKETPTK